MMMTDRFRLFAAHTQMSLFADLDDAGQQVVAGGGLVVKTGAARAPKGFYRNPSSPENFYTTTAAEGTLYPLNNGFYRTGAYGLNLLNGIAYNSGKGVLDYPAESAAGLRGA